ncbi:hypothetical protein P43SY_006776 [Pythium insidiosum]|uniref:Elongator complex protein 5 n=1 Tax=Pythium insidiosum TaxID=114742 RepID=A0AAD5LQ51_PYTIN|nr:hypothetical protein P43SY_006776 [Pythium insidiosum]
MEELFVHKCVTSDASDAATPASLWTTTQRCECVLVQEPPQAHGASRAVLSSIVSMTLESKKTSRVIVFTLDPASRHLLPSLETEKLSRIDLSSAFEALEREPVSLLPRLQDELETALARRKTDDARRSVVVVVDSLNLLLETAPLPAVLRWLKQIRLDDRVGSVVARVSTAAVDPPRAAQAIARDVATTVVHVETPSSLRAYSILAKERRREIPKRMHGMVLLLRKKKNGRPSECVQYFQVFGHRVLYSSDGSGSSLGAAASSSSSGSQSTASSASSFTKAATASTASTAPEIKAPPVSHSDVSFNLSLSAEEHAAKQNVQLPYLHQGADSASNLLLIDEDDPDWDDDDLDDDLDLCVMTKRVSFSDLPDEERWIPEEDEEEHDDDGATEDVVVDAFGDDDDDEEEDGGSHFQDDSAISERASASLSPFARLVGPEPPRLPSQLPPATSAGAVVSPVRKKITALQDRRVNTILLEALQLVEFSREELAGLERTVKRLRDAVHGFSILIDKQVNIIGAETLEERGRVRADIQDLAGNLKVSYEALATTCSRMKQTLSTGKQQLQVHKKRLSPGRAAAIDPVAPAAAARIGLYGVQLPPATSLSPKPTKGSVAAQQLQSPTLANSALSLEPAPGRVSLLSILGSDTQARDGDGEGEDGELPPRVLTPALLEGVLRSLGLAETEFLEAKDLSRVLHELLTVTIAKSRVLTFMGKAFHRRLLPSYTRELVRLVLETLQLSPIAPSTSPFGASPVVALPQATLFDFICSPPYRCDALFDRVFVSDANEYVGEPSPVVPPRTPVAPNPFTDQFSRNGGVLHNGQIVQTLLVNRPDPELLETAEQTLAMAKLLHDLATAETEAKHGDRLSRRPQPARSHEFAKVYLATSKELLSKETGVG